MLKKVTKLTEVENLKIQLKKAQETIKALKEAEQNFEILTEALPDIVWTTDKNGRQNFFNKRWYEFTGLSPKQTFETGDVKKVFHPDDLKATQEKWFEAVKKGKSYTFEHRIKNGKTGEYCWFIERGVPVKDSKGRITKWFGTSTDINDQKQAIESSQESEARFKSLADNAPVLIWLGDTTKACTYFNKAWLDFTGRTLKQELKNGWKTDVHPEDLPRSLDIFEKAFANHEKFTKEYRLKRADEEYRWMIDIGVPRFTPDGTFIGYIGSCIDITERRELEKRKDEFISMASHELKTPLTSIKGYTQILQQYNHDDRCNYFLEKVNLQVERLTELVNDLLDVSRIQAGKLELHKEKVKLFDLITGVVEDMQHLSPTHKIILEGKTKRSLKVDRYRIQQVLVNLISNAVKYSPNSDKLVVRIKDEPRFVQVSVQDFGIGIRARDKEKVFDRFYQASNKIRQSFSGLGLGLYISSEIMRRHNGRLWVVSEKGKGSTFSFALPVRKIKL